MTAEVEKQLAVAEKAKEKGFDLSTSIESKPVADLADRTETIIGPLGIAKRYREVFEEKKQMKIDRKDNVKWNDNKDIIIWNKRRNIKKRMIEGNETMLKKKIGNREEWRQCRQKTQEKKDKSKRRYADSDQRRSG